MDYVSEKILKIIFVLSFFLVVLKKITWPYAEQTFCEIFHLFTLE